MPRLLVVVAFVASLLVPALATADEPAAVPPEVRADAEALLGHYEALATLVEANGQDSCETLARALEGFAAEHGPAMRETAARLEAIDAEVETALQRAYADRLEAFQARMLPPLTACVGNEAVVAAMESLSSGKPDAPAGD